MEISKPSDDARSQVVMLVCGSVLVLVFGLIGVGGYAFYRGAACVSELRYIPPTSVCCFQGEIVFARSRSTPAGPSGPSRVWAVDPNTGQTRDMGIELSGLVLSTVTDGNRLWVASWDEIVEFDGTSSSRFRFDRLVSPLAPPFLLDAFLTTILKDDKGNDYLYRFEEGEWKKRATNCAAGHRTQVGQERSKQSVYSGSTYFSWKCFHSGRLGNCQRRQDR